MASDAHDAKREAEMAEPDDITKPEAYSIQDAKLKTEEDNRLAAAEKKKEAVRRIVAQMRREFEELVREVRMPR